MDETEKYEIARRRVEEKKKFFKHLTSYLTMSVFFFVLNALTAWGSWWFYWPMLGWGIGILSHYFRVFGFPGTGPLEEDWERREMNAEMKRLEGKSKAPASGEELDLPTLEKQKRKDWDEEDLV